MLGVPKGSPLPSLHTGSAPPQPSRPTLIWTRRHHTHSLELNTQLRIYLLGLQEQHPLPARPLSMLHPVCLELCPPLALPDPYTWLLSTQPSDPTLDPFPGEHPCPWVRDPLPIPHPHTITLITMDKLNICQPPGCFFPHQRGSFLSKGLYFAVLWMPSTWWPAWHPEPSVNVCSRVGE